MTIVVQNCLTKEYLSESEGWTPEFQDAKRFGSSVDAYFHCKQHSIPDSQVILAFGRPDFDVKLPVSASCK